MKLTVKLYATLSKYLPDDATDHATVMDVADSSTPYNILDHFKVPRESAKLIFLNGLYVTPEERSQPVFKEGDTLAIWPPVAGG